jgi:thiaminase/transcriptional activator TenA
MRAVADGTLADEAFNEWIRQDFLFVVGLKRFVAELAREAPGRHLTGFEGALAALDAELDRFRRHASTHGVELGGDPVSACSSYLAFLDECRVSGYPVALTAYYGCERAYLESWSGVRTNASLSGPCGDWIDNWSSGPFRAFVGWLAELLDEAPIDERDRLREVFARTVELEIDFWDACWRKTGR